MLVVVSAEDGGTAEGGDAAESGLPLPAPAGASDLADHYDLTISHPAVDTPQFVSFDRWLAGAAPELGLSCALIHDPVVHEAVRRLRRRPVADRLPPRLPRPLARRRRPLRPAGGGRGGRRRPGGQPAGPLPRLHRQGGRPRRVDAPRPGHAGHGDRPAVGRRPGTDRGGAPPAAAGGAGNLRVHQAGQRLFRLRRRPRGPHRPRRPRGPDRRPRPRPPRGVPDPGRGTAAAPGVRRWRRAPGLLAHSELFGRADAVLVAVARGRRPRPAELPPSVAGGGPSPPAATAAGVHRELGELSGLEWFSTELCLGDGPETSRSR